MQVSLLHYALCHHGIGHFHETCDIGSLDIVDVSVGLFAILDTLFMDVVHNLMELLVHFCFAPAQSHRVLCHLQARCCHTARIDRLAWSEELSGSDKLLSSFGCASHVGHFGYADRFVG